MITAYDQVANCRSTRGRIGSSNKLMFYHDVKEFNYSLPVIHINYIAILNKVFFFNNILFLLVAE